MKTTNCILIKSEELEEVVKIFRVFVIVVILGVITIVGILYSGLYNVSAMTPQGKLAHWVTSTTMRASVDRRARNIAVPDLVDEALQLAGINDFDSMCAACHGTPAEDPEAMGLGLNPPAPDLAESAAKRTAAELFWITRNGIRMTGMPAWGASHDDEDLWPVVAFMTRLPGLSAEDYQSMLAKAEGIGHHAVNGDSHSHGDKQPDSEKQSEEHHHGGHEHQEP
jgi:mono/diheme cytochrome c family protein